MQQGVVWMCDWLPPINLWNVWYRSNDMSDGMTDAYREWPNEFVKAPHAAHYKISTPEPIDVIEQWGLNFNLGNALKYIARCNYKGQRKEDLEKAVYYLQREMER